jgi:hypothetical protein
MSLNVTALAGFTVPAPVRLRTRRRGAGFSDEFPSIPCLPWRRIGVLGGREAALPYPSAYSRAAARISSIALDEFRRELGEQAEHVVDHQDLTVAGGEPPIPIVGTATAGARGSRQPPR